MCHTTIVAWSSKIKERTDRWQMLSNFCLSKPRMDVYSRKEVSGTVCSHHLLQPCKICQVFQEFSGIFRNIQQISKGLIKRLVALFRHCELFILWPQLGWVLRVKKIDTFSNGVYMLLRLSVMITNDDTDYDDVWEGVNWKVDGEVVVT